MTAPLSDDLRVRLVTAVDAGETRRVRRQTLWRGAFHSDQVDGAVAAGRPRKTAPDGRRPALAPDRGSCPGHSEAGQREARRHGGRDRRPSPGRAWCRHIGERGLAVTGPPRPDLQKKPRTPPSSSVLTFCNGATPGSTFSLTCRPNAWSSLTKPAPRPRWPGCAGARPEASGAGRRCRTAIGRQPPSSAPCGWRA